VTVGRYALLVAVVAGLGSLLALAAAGQRLGAADRQALVVGAALAAANTLVAHALATWAARRSNRTFFGAVLGGTVVRMALVLTAVVLAITRFGLPAVPLAASLLTFFVLFLCAEVRLLQAGVRRSAAA
jgi:hypothetical protein